MFSAANTCDPYVLALSPFPRQVVVDVEPSKPLVSYYPAIALKFGVAAVKVMCEGRPISRWFSVISLVLLKPSFLLKAPCIMLSSICFAHPPLRRSGDSAESLDLEEDFGLDVVLL
jgi:hypothetical protein